MKIIRIVFACVFLSLFTVSSAKAQAKIDSISLQKRKEKNVTQAQRNSIRLALTTQQKPVFKQISEKYSKLTRDLKVSSLTRVQKLDSVQKINVAKDSEVKILLSAEQFATYKEIVDEKRHEMEMARNRQGIPLED